MDISSYICPSITYLSFKKIILKFAIYYWDSFEPKLLLEIVKNGFYLFGTE
jgi:hypothetical protein